MGDERELRSGKALADQPPDLAQIYDTIPIGLAFLTPDCRYLQINQRMTEICGIPVADHLGRSVRETLPRLADQVERIVAAVIATGEPITDIEVSGERPDESGAHRFWTTSWQPLKGPDGRIIGVNVAAEEITHRKRAQAALEFARVSRHTTVGAMTASIAHEINQPLTAIVTNASAGLRWLRQSPANVDEAKAVLERIGNDGRRASQIVSSIRAMFGKGAVARARVDLNEIIREVLSQVHADLARRAVTLRTDLMMNPPSVLADQIQLQQVVHNVVMNALEAMAELVGREHVLRVSSEPAPPDQISVSVHDTGPGVAQPEIDRVFDPFFTTKSNGMGMGLAICRSIMKAHGGNLWISATGAGGTTFQLSLPVDH